MRNLKYITAALFCVSLFFSCYKDDTKLADKPINEIGIKNDARDTINIYYNETLRISAEITSNTDVTYEWGIGEYKESEKEDGSGNKFTANTTVFKKVSNEKDFEYVVRELGHFMIREMVTNDDGSSMKYHHVFVISPFEEGFMILGRKPNGKGSLAFLKTLIPEEVAMGMKPIFRQNVYQYVNGSEMFEDPVDCFKIRNSVFILSGSSQKLEQIHAKTLESEIVYDFKFYEPNFIPTSRGSYDGRFCNEIFVMSKNGGCAQVQLAEQSIFPFNGRDGLPKNYKFTKMYARPSYFASATEVFMGADDNVVCFEGPDESGVFGFWPCYDYFKKRKVMHVFQNEKQDGNDVFVISNDGADLKITKINASMTDRTTGKGLWVEFETTLTNTSIMTKESQILVNDLYTFICFSHENKVFKWNYTQNNLPTQPFITLPEGEEIRCLNHYVISLNEDEYLTLSKEVQTQVYVASYNPNRSGEFKGSLYIFDVATGEEIARYEGISHEPVKMFYKIK